ncbi:MAG: exonuclease domain-containing protein [Candidatus Omnitrophica bacterium]|nr:exonuclease domain-containing protein [Candidatus Omnitrophota bacterium]
MIKEIPLLIAIDIETTGLFPENGERICEIAILKIKNGKIFDKFVSLINPEKSISPAATLISGITNEMINSSPTFKEIAGDIVNFLNTNEPILAHNAAFDLSFLNYQMELCGFPRLQNEVIDTLLIARKYFNFQSNSLGDLVSRFSIPVDKLHRAYNDAISAYRLMEILWKNLKETKEFSELLITQNSITSLSPELNNVLPFWLLDALKNKTPVVFRYIDRNGNVSVRNIQPKEISISGNYIYLIGFCPLKKDERKFRLDRILEVMENIE